MECCLACEFTHILRFIYNTFAESCQANRQNFQDVGKQLWKRGVGEAWIPNEGKLQQRNIRKRTAKPADFDAIWQIILINY